MNQVLKTIEYGGRQYPVTFKQTRKWSHSSMKKQGLVHHATTSNSYKGGLDWLVNGYNPIDNTYGNGGSSHFIVGRNVGEIAMLGQLDQKLWHAGGIRNPNERFKRIAVKDDSLGGAYVNPNLYLDGIEYVGGVDVDNDGKVETHEVNLTEWQYACGEQIVKWHAEVNGYKLGAHHQLIHQDIASDKPDLTEILEELVFRIFQKKEIDVIECRELQKTVETQQGMIVSLINMVKSLLGLIK